MTTTAILRFSDYEIETINVHLDIIRSKKATWWAWWKKKHEDMCSKTLEEIANNCPVKIGLVNRMANKYYTALCTNVSFNPRGKSIKSPDPQLTPAYYRNSEHPAWFMFSRIDSIESEEFVKQFGGMPQGDPTLFFIQRSEDGSPRIENISTSEINIIEAPGDSILHISDLHFGEHHGFSKENEEDPIQKNSLSSILSARIKELPNFKIGIVVVTGDIITKGDSNGYPAAIKFLNSLLHSIKLEVGHVVIVPGNHDIWLKDVEHPTWNYTHEEPYRLFIRGFYGKQITEIERFDYFHTTGGWHLSFVGLNSSRPRLKETMDYGYVGQDRYGPILSRIIRNNGSKTTNELASEKRLNFAVLHHHLLPTALVCEPDKKRPVSLTLDAGQLVSDLQASKIHFALHGHQHVPFLGSTSRVRYEGTTWRGHTDPLFVLGCGSSGAKVDELTDELRNNTFSIYTPKHDGLHIYTEEFNRSMKPRPYMNLIIPF